MQMSSYVVRTDQEADIAKQLFQALSEGEARMGWSWTDDQDLLRIIQANNEGKWAQLDGNQQDAWYCHGFLDRVQKSDLIFYPNVPDYGSFCVAEITGDYRFLPADKAIDGDFRSVRACRLITPTPVSKSDAIVPPLLRARLGLQQRFYQLKADSEINAFLDRLDEIGRAVADVAATFEKMLADTAERMSAHWAQYFPRKDLSNILAKVLEQGGYGVRYQEGAGEKGADLVVELENPFIKEPIRIGVQVGSYRDQVSKFTVKEKLDQLLSGWEDNKLKYGSLVLSGKCDHDARSVIDDHNHQHPDKRITLLDGRDLAMLILNIGKNGPSISAPWSTV
jgi:hypothetical protein